MQDPGFWADLAGRIGAPIFAATLVGCLLSDRFETTHGVLLAVGLALIAWSHRREYHTGAGHEHG